jgi:hypothetical protein
MDSMLRLDQLLTRFHERQQRGQMLSLDELGAGSPEQLDALRHACKTVAAMVSVLGMDSAHCESTPTQPTRPAGEGGGIPHEGRRA